MPKRVVSVQPMRYGDHMIKIRRTPALPRRHGHAAVRSAVRLTEIVALGALTLVLATIAQARHHSKASHEGQAGQFDYYLLSLSWAPTYCLTHADDGAECSGKGYGFVVHGLWPQYDSGGYPADCETNIDLTAQATARGRTVYPSERLMKHEWQEHGTCSGLSALDYFNLADRATAAVRVPPELEAPKNDGTYSAPQIIGMFERANPGLPGNSLVIACSRAQLSEIRICLNKDLSVRSCGHGVRTTCPKVALGIPATR
jgi:ribonuclease T2